jgi:hypothetical protein
MSEKPQKPSEPQNDTFELLIQEAQTEPDLTDEQRAQKIAALREGQAGAKLPAQVSQRRASVKGTELEKLRIPDFDYAPGLVAQIAASLLRSDDFRVDDYELAVARALRLLDTTHRILERHKRERASGAEQGEVENRIPFGKGLMEITGADRPEKAEKRFIDHLHRRGHLYDTDRMIVTSQGMELLKIHKPSSRQIKEALAFFRKNGFTQKEIDVLREQFLAGTKRVHTENLRKKKKKSG